MSQGDIFLKFLFNQWCIGYPIVIGLMLIFYLIYLVIKNPGLVDFAWECSHLSFGITFYVLFCAEDNRIRSIVFLALLSCWFMRLGGFILITRIIPGEQDPRYEELAKEKNPYIYFFINYQLQGFLVSLCAIPLFFVFYIDQEITWSFYVGVVLIVIGILGEALSDYQLQSYKNRMRQQRRELSNQAQDVTNYEATDRDQQKPQVKYFQTYIILNQRRIFQEGLWAKSRHPNLFFELVTWFGFAFAGIQEPITVLGFLGPIILYLIMRYLTVPLTENHMRETRPDYEDFCKRTNMFLIV